MAQLAQRTNHQSVKSNLSNAVLSLAQKLSHKTMIRRPKSISKATCYLSANHRRINTETSMEQAVSGIKTQCMTVLSDPYLSIKDKSYTLRRQRR